MVVLYPSLNKAKTVLGHLKQMAEGELRLTLHPEKTRLTTFGQGFDFLGCTFKSQQRVARKRALEKFKDRVRELTPRQTHFRMNAWTHSGWYPCSPFSPAGVKSAPRRRGTTTHSLL